AATPRPQADPDPTALIPATTTAEAAVAQFVQATGASYAGDCAATRSPDDLGKVCSRFVAERGNRRAYLLGRTFSEFSAWAFVQQGAEGWTVVSTAPLDLTDTSDAVPWTPE